MGKSVSQFNPPEFVAADGRQLRLVAFFTEWIYEAFFSVMPDGMPDDEQTREVLARAEHLLHKHCGDAPVHFARPLPHADASPEPSRVPPMLCGARLLSKPTRPNIVGHSELLVGWCCEPAELAQHGITHLVRDALAGLDWQHHARDVEYDF